MPTGQQMQQIHMWILSVMEPVEGGLTGKVAPNGDVSRKYVPHIHTPFSILMYKALWPSQRMPGFLGFAI